MNIQYNISGYNRIECKVFNLFLLKYNLLIYIFLRHYSFYIV